MDDYQAEYMGSSLLNNNYDDLIVKIPKSIPKMTGHKPLVESFPYTAQLLSEPRRHQNLPSKHNGTNNQINQEYKYEPDHTEPICESDGQPTTGYRHTRRRTLSSPQLSPTFERRQTQVIENQERHVRQPQLAPTYERRQTIQFIENQGRHVRQPVYLPKGLQYNETTNWESFFVKFNRYADVSR